MHLEGPSAGNPADCVAERRLHQEKSHLPQPLLPKRRPDCDPHRSGQLRSHMPAEEREATST